MKTTRDDAMAALRSWSRPGRRADLTAAAWQAGETNITALAEAARTSRPTVYADLRSRGIDPDHRPKEDPDMTPVVIDGIDGSNLQDVRDGLARFAEENPGDETALDAEVKRTTPIFFAAYRYNELRSRLAAEEHARRDRDRALHLVETRWEALSTAGNWLAAHHAYIVAVDEARTAISMWAARAAAAAQMSGFSTEEREVYEQRILAEGHPPVEPLNAYGDNEARQLRTNLDQAHARRKELAAETLGLSQPASAKER